MPTAILVASGLFAVAVGCWRGFVAARSALLPLTREGDPTRALVEAAQPVHARARIRLAVRSGMLAVAWIMVAMYGTYLVTVGLETIR